MRPVGNDFAEICIRDDMRHFMKEDALVEHPAFPLHDYFGNGGGAGLAEDLAALAKVKPVFRLIASGQDGRAE